MKNRGVHIEVVQHTFDDIEKTLKKFDRAATDQIATVVGEAGFQLQKDAKRLAPVDFGVLRASIYFDHKSKVLQDVSGISTIGKRGQQLRLDYSTLQVRKESGRKGLDVIVGSPLDYAEKQNNKTGFLTKSFRKISGEFSKEIEKELDKIIKRLGLN